MEAKFCYLLHILARKNVFVSIFYVLATLVIIEFNYQTTNQFHEIPTKIFISVSPSSMPVTQILNVSFTYEQRSEMIKNQCHNKRQPMIIHGHRKLINYLGFVLRSHSLFYCSVPKVATRTLLNYITYLHIRDEIIPSLINNSGIYSNDRFNLFNKDFINTMFSNLIHNDSISFLSHVLTILKSNGSQLDLWRLYQKLALPYVRPGGLPDSSTLFSSSFTRVIFVRHPLERLASAYTDKIGSIKSEPKTLYDSLRRTICRKYASFYLTTEEQHDYLIKKTLENDIHEPCAKVIPSFEHFLEHMLSDSSQVDVHWQPYSILCGVCRLNYNFIGKYETLQNDFYALKLKLGLDTSDWNDKNHFSTGKTKETYQLMYSKLPKHLLCNLKNFYYQDLKLFNYRFEDYLPNHQQINCTFQRYRRFNALSF